MDGGGSILAMFCRGQNSKMKNVQDVHSSTGTDAGGSMLTSFLRSKNTRSLKMYKDVHF